MTNTPKVPDSEVIEKTVNNFRSVSQRLDALTLNLDELIAMVEADIRKSPINIYRREKGTRLAMSRKQGN